jgi:MFS family permease
MAATPPDDPAAAAAKPSPGYARYVLTLLVIVYILNFIDRQILSILAEDIKRDLGLSDADIGFLYGTAFGVFYALFGIPLGRLADSWNRVKLMSPSGRPRPRPRLSRKPAASWPLPASASGWARRPQVPAPIR